MSIRLDNTFLKKLLLLIIVLLIWVCSDALGTLRVDTITELPAAHTSLKERDADGKFAPMLIIKTELKGLGFQNVGRPSIHESEYNSGDHQYEFYMNEMININ